MKTLIVMKGLPASGKTTLAKKMVEEAAKSGVVATRVNNDDINTEMFGGIFTKGAYETIKAERIRRVRKGFSLGDIVILDNTNLSLTAMREAEWFARESKAHLEIVDLTHHSLETCLERNSKRDNPVPEEVIKKMYTQHISK